MGTRGAALKEEPPALCFSASPPAALFPLLTAWEGRNVCVRVCAFLRVQRDFMLVLLSNAPAGSHQQQSGVFFWMGAAKRRRRERRQKEFIITPLGPPHYCIAFLDSGSVGLLTACVCVYCIPPFPQLDDCPGMLTEESAGGVCRCERACVCLCAGTEGDSAGGE